MTRGAHHSGIKIENWEKYHEISGNIEKNKSVPDVLGF
jgi:hypothetical protein